jgi:hypothetical protein
MTVSIDTDLKAVFRRLFPEQAVRMEAAQSPEELDALHLELVANSRKQLDTAIALSGGVPGNALGATASDVALLLTPRLRKALAEARLDKVEQEIKSLIKGLSEIAELKAPSPEMLSSRLVSVGAVPFGPPTLELLTMACSSSSSEAVLGASIGSAVGSGGISAGVAISAVLVIVAVAVTIFYFASTSRKCVVLLMSELDDALTFESAHFDHGDQRSLRYSELVPASVSGKMGLFPGATFVIADRLGGAYGTHFGFTYTYGDTRLGVGALCGLSNDNQCWSALDESAAQVSKKLFDAKTLSHEASNGKIRMAIHGNSHRGNPAFFVARAYPA